MSAIDRLAEAVQDLRRRLPSMSTHEVVGVSPLLLAGADGQQIEPRRTWGWPVAVGDQVLVVRVGPDLWALGVVSKPIFPAGSGTVAGAAAGGLVPVTVPDGRGGTRIMSVPSTVTVTVGDRVGLSWAQTAAGWDGHITGVLQADPTPAPPPPPPTTESEADRPPSVWRPRVYTVKASSIRTWRDGGWRAADAKGRAYQGRYATSSYGNSHGFWFYGANAFTQLDGMVIQKVEIYMHAVPGVGPGGASPAHLRAHGHARPSSSKPPIVGTWSDSSIALRDGEKGWREPPNGVALAELLRTGAASGLAVVYDGSADYGAWASLAENPLSGSIRITATEAEA